MLNIFRNKRSGLLVWILMAMLIIGLAGFGIGQSGALSANSVASVGDREITPQEYSRRLDQEMRQISQQLGENLTMEQAKGYGIDRMVLGQLISDATLDIEAARLGVSADDESVRATLLSIPAFKASDGGFDREAYTHAVRQVGMNPPEFERNLRHEATREMVATAVQSAATMPEIAVDTVVGFLGEKRGFDWISLDATLLPEPVPAPTDADLEAEHAAHPARYTRPETRQVSYASVTPEALAATIQVPEADIRAYYDAHPEQFSTPERRIVDRIGFADMAEATAAKARLDSGEVSFDALATERGLTAQDIDQGEVAAASLDATVRDAVFATDGPGVAGPVETPLGPSIYRVNAVLAATSTSFEDAREGLARTQSMADAQRQIADDTAVIEDLIASGATLEDIASETSLELGQIALNEQTVGGLASDPAFTEAAAEADTGIETDLIHLADGGIATLRVERVDTPTVIPLAEIRDRVAADWTSGQTTAKLQALARGFETELAGGLTFEALAQRLDRTIQVAAPILRGEIVPGVAPAIVADIFAADPKGIVIRDGGDDVVLAQVREIIPFDPTAADTAPIVERLRGQYQSQAADDVLQLYVTALRDAAGVRLNQERIDAVLSQFP